MGSMCVWRVGNLTAQAVLSLLAPSHETMRTKQPAIAEKPGAAGVGRHLLGVKASTLTLSPKTPNPEA